MIMPSILHNRKLTHIERTLAITFDSLIMRINFAKTTCGLESID